MTRPKDYYVEVEGFTTGGGLKRIFFNSVEGAKHYKKSLNKDFEIPLKDMQIMELTVVKMEKV